MRSEPAAAAGQRIADILAERILSGELKPGTRIKQDELAEELNTSRIPVRDALRTLEAKGLVAIRSNNGARVVELSLRDLEMSYEIRERLEPLLLADSLPNLSEEDIGEMHDVLRAMDDADDVERFLSLDRKFHWISYRGHQSPLLAEMVERLWDTTQSYRRAYARLSLKNGGTIMRSEHRLLFGAVARREVETAQMALAMHIRRTRIGLVRYGYLIAQPPVTDPIDWVEANSDGRVR